MAESFFYGHEIKRGYCQTKKLIVKLITPFGNLNSQMVTPQRLGLKVEAIVKYL